MKSYWLPYFYPDDGLGTGIADKPQVKPEKSDDDTAFLDTLLIDKDKDKSKDKTPKPEDEETEEDLIEESDEELPDEDKRSEEEPEDELLVDTNSRNLDFKKIKEKYPEFAKTTEYREMKNSYYREGQYTELFPTIEDAKEAAENNATFTKLNDAIVNQGNSVVLLEAIKGASQEALHKFSTSFLDNLNKFDSNLYVEAVTPVVKRLARQIYSDGQKILKRNPESEDGQALAATARNIMQHFFEDADLVDKQDSPPDPRLKAKEEELSTRENQIRMEKWNSAATVVQTSAERHLDKLIVDGLDPDNRLNEFTRDSLVEKIKNDVRRQLGSDNGHVRRMDSLWKRAEAEGYDKGSLSRIVAAYLERARPVIASSRTKYRSIALKGSSRRESSENDETQEKPLRIANRGSSGRSPRGDGKVNLKEVDPKKIDYRNTTDDDIFEGRAKLKTS